MRTLDFIILFLLLCIFEYFHNKKLKINALLTESIETHHTVNSGYLGKRVGEESSGFLSSDTSCERVLFS